MSAKPLIVFKVTTIQQQVITNNDLSFTQFEMDIIHHSPTKLSLTFFTFVIIQQAFVVLLAARAADSQKIEFN